MPNVLSVSPLPNAVDVILGANIVVTFDSLIDMTTVTTSTFSVTGPAQTQILTTNQLIQSDPSYINDRDDIIGTFSSVTNSFNQTVLTFVPKNPLQPNTTYNVLLIGSGALLVGSTISSTTGQPLASNYIWSFSTGESNTTSPPLQAPLPYQYAAIDPNAIKIRINNGNAGDLLNQNITSGFEVDLIFPVALDTTSFSTTDILLSLEQFLGDPTIPFPTGLTPTITITANTIKIVLM